MKGKAPPFKAKAKGEKADPKKAGKSLPPWLKKGK